MAPVPGLLYQGWSSPHTSITHRQKWGWGSAGTPGLRDENRGGKESRARTRESVLMTERIRIKPGGQTNLRDIEIWKRCMKGLSGEQVMGRENTKRLNQND